MSPDARFKTREDEKMKTGHKAAAIGCLAVAVGSAVYRRWMIRMSLREFIGDAVITLPPKAESLQARYHLFLQSNRAKSRRQIQEEIVALERRLRESRQYIGQPKEQLEVEFFGEHDFGETDSVTL